MSHISRPIPAYLIHNIQKYIIDYNQQSLYSPFDTNNVHVMVLLEYNTRQKQNKTKPHPVIIPYAVPYVSPPPALDLYLKRGGEVGSYNKVRKT